MPAPQTIAGQSIDALGGPASVLVRQRRDHEELEALLEELERSPCEAQPQVLRRVWRLAFSHAFAEEAVLWPALRRHVDDGDQLTLRIEQEHQAICALAVEIEELDPTHDEWAAKVAAVAELLRTDARDEEDVVLPHLQQALDPSALRRLGTTWEAVRRVAPTRPHPVVSRRPPGNVLSAAPLAALDRTRDRLDRLAQPRGGRAGWKPAASLSSAIASLAGSIERLPPLRRGEDPSTRAG